MIALASEGMYTRFEVSTAPQSAQPCPQLPGHGAATTQGGCREEHYDLWPKHRSSPEEYGAIWPRAVRGKLDSFSGVWATWCSQQVQRTSHHLTQ